MVLKAYFVHCTINLPADAGTEAAMLSFVVFFARRKRPFVWKPAVDLSDPYVAAALAPMNHS